MQDDVEQFLLPRRCCQACRYEAKETYPLLPFEHDLFGHDNDDHEEPELKHICPKGTYIITNISQILKFAFSKCVFKEQMKVIYGIQIHVIIQHPQEQPYSSKTYQRIK